jgi:hypothetical protein
MIANIPWNITNKYSGMFRGGEAKLVERDAAQRHFGEVADVGVSGTERQTVPDDDPQHSDDARRKKALHENVENVLRADETAVEQRETRKGHHQNERRRSEHPSRVTRVDHGRRILGQGPGRNRQSGDDDCG